MMLRILLLHLSLCLLAAPLRAQDGLTADESTALAHARQALSAGTTAITADDLRDLAVDHSYTDERLGITYVYLQQRVGSVPVEGAIATVALRDGRVSTLTQRFVGGLADGVGSVVPALDDRAAIAHAVAALGRIATLPARRADTPVDSRGRRRYLAPELVQSPILVEDVYQAAGEGKLRRAYAVTVDLRDGDLHRVFIDARSGELLRDQSLTQHCAFTAEYNGHAHESHDGSCDGTRAEDAPGYRPGVAGLRFPHDGAASAKTVRAAATAAETSAGILGDGSSYLVYPWPTESPSHGAQTLVSEPADPLASPFGWHDTNGAPGPEFTITRGNNAHAYVDALDDDEPSDPEPDGGASLTFDFPYDPTVEPVQQLDATTTNLFYATNMIHDFAWHYGFDEQAGNFQQRNYTGRGQGGDYVLAQSEDGARTNTQTGGPNDANLNNANFSTPADGGNGRMQMYLWNVNRFGNPVSVAAPASIAGRTYGDLGNPGAGWGQGTYVDSTTRITAGVVGVRDDGPARTATFGCEEYIDPAAVAGKVAIIDRGVCQFGAKALRAQRAGAVAVIICNFEDANINLAPGTSGLEVNIPVFMMQQAGCQQLRLDAAANPNFQISIKQPIANGTDYYSGSLDNGIVAHEYGHGISTRLTGGPNVSCLSSEEQMGEGWSDFFSLVTSVRPGDRPETRRGIGTFVERQPNDGAGIRPFPYSTDMSINPVTYAGVADVNAFSQPHGTGSIWASMIWDLHWAMVDRYGFSDNLFGDTLGNNKAIQLVMTGLKLQPCAPGFVDGRDAILAADRLLYGGVNRRLIWEVFARRGLGADADQGDPDDRADGVAGFQLPLELSNRTFFTKDVTDVIQPGGVVDVTLAFSNWLDSVAVLASVDITDELPAGASLVAGSVNVPFEQTGDLLTFELTELMKGDSATIRYQYMASTEVSRLIYHQPIDGPRDTEFFDRYNDNPDASGFFELITTFGYNDTYSFDFESRAEETRPALEIFEDYPFVVQGDRPMFSFYHQYQMTSGVEAGIVEILDEAVGEWATLPNSKFLRNGYTGPAPYQSFVLPFLDGYSGEQLDEWEQVLIDLSDYSGKTVRLRWRFGRPETGEAGLGWTIDEVAHIDAVAYNTEATATVNGVRQRVRAADIGTLVDYLIISSTEETAAAAVQLSAFPNPVSHNLTLAFAAAGGSGTIEVISPTGQVVATRALAPGQQRLNLPMADLPTGVYAVRVARDGATNVVRVVRQ